MAISTRMLMLIKNIYTLWALPRLLLPVTFFSRKNLIDPFVLFKVQGLKKDNNISMQNYFQFQSERQTTK